MNVAVRLVCAVVVLLMAACTRDELPERETELPESETGIRFERTTRFDGRVLTVELTGADGRKEKFDSVRDEWYSWPYSPFLPNHAGRRWTLLKTRNDSSSIVYALVSWNDDDPTDYLAAGWWLRFPGQFSRRLSLENATGSPFIDGPELDASKPPEIPNAGTATYLGGAGGLYQYRYGSGWTDAEAPVAAEEFTATIVITADFAEGTLSGCMGCIGDLELERAHLYSILGRPGPEPVALPTDYELHFGITDINPNGTFENTDVTVNHPERTVTGSDGHWGGHLSNIPDADGNPRLVAGLTTVEFDEDDGSQGRFQALFTGLGESLRPTAPNEDP